MAKENYETKVKPTAPKPVAAVKEKCIICKSDDILVKSAEMMVKGEKSVVKQVFCQRIGCRYVATYVDGKIV